MTGPVATILVIIGGAVVFCFSGLCLLILSDFLLRRIRGKPEEPTLFYCERCEERTAVRVTSATATGVACSDHDLCGFRRIIRDELHPGNVGVTYDPGPGKTPHPQE